MVAGSLLLTINDAASKWITAEYPIGEFLFLRGLFIFVPIAIVAQASGGLASLRVRDFRGQLLRAALMAASVYLFIFCIGIMPLADVVAIVFAGPLFVTALAPSLLAEHVDWRRWAAVVVGFAGVVLMTRPSLDSVRLVALVPLMVALLAALRDVATRKLSFVDSSAATLCFTTVTVMVVGLASLPWAWIGLVPRQTSTGGKERMGRISKQGDQYLRWLLVAGAMSVIRHARRKDPASMPWLAGLMERRPLRVAAVALANKIARIAWVVLTRGETYRPAAL